MLEIKIVRKYRVLKRSEQSTGGAGGKCTAGKSHQFHPGSIDSHGLCRQFILANGLPPPADPGAFDPEGPRGGNGRKNPDEIGVGNGRDDPESENINGVKAVDTVDAAGDIHRSVKVLQQQFKNLGEGQGYNGQVISLQPYAGRSQGDADDHGENRSQRQNQQEGQVYIELVGR